MTGTYIFKRFPQAILEYSQKLMGKLRPREKTVLFQGHSMVESNLGCRKMSALGSAVHITTLSCIE